MTHISKSLRSVLGVLVTTVLLLAMALPLPMPVLAADDVAAPVAYPVLSGGMDYYQTTFPTGLRYSPTWNGTYSYVPNNVEVVLYDDTYSADWGICVFGVPKGTKPPSGAQGGTTQKALTHFAADNALRQYTVDAVAKPFDDEILEVMESDLITYIDTDCRYYAPAP